MSADVTACYLEGLASVAARPLPEGAARQAASCLVDYLACAYLGHELLAGEVSALLDLMGRGGGRAVVVGEDVRVSPQAAALLNGMCAHAAELDDGHRVAMMHLGSPIISALLAAAAVPGLEFDGGRFLKGIVMGYEAAVRLAAAIQPGHKARGFHATGTCGAVGAALGIGFACGFSDRQLASALAASVTGAAGLLEMASGDSALKPFNVGNAAVTGLSAAFVGTSGRCGRIDPLGGQRGLLRAMADDVDESTLVSGLASGLAVDTVYRKTYASCRHSHAAIEAAMTAARDNGVDAFEVEAVRIETYGLAIAGHDHANVSGESSAKMSIPYSVAAALRFGAAGPDQFGEACLADELVQRLAARVTISESPELSALVPAKRAAIAHIQTSRGTFSARIDYPKGEPENPIAPDELEDKFMSLMSSAGQDGAYAHELLECAWQVGERFYDLLELLR